MQNDSRDETPAPGRPLLFPQQDAAMVNYNIRLPFWMARAARRMGDGNFSAGVRFAIDFVLRNKKRLTAPSISLHNSAMFKRKARNG